MYQENWSGATVGEELVCQRETGNIRDAFAVSVMRASEVVGHIPRKISCICSVFLRRGGSLCCIVTGSRRYSRVPQGGLEIPCWLLLEGLEKEILKVKKLVSSALMKTEPVESEAESGDKIRGNTFS